VVARWLVPSAGIRGWAVEVRHVLEDGNVRLEEVDGGVKRGSSVLGAAELMSGVEVV
jgi:hypothetical protein